MRLHLKAILMSVLLATTVFGQLGPDDRPGRRRERARRGPGMGRMLDRLADRLDLDEEQRAEFEEIKAAHRERMEAMRPRWAEIREAMRSGDEARASELREQMPVGGGPWESMRQAMDELEPILNDEQYEQLSEMRGRMDRGREQREVFRRITRDLPGELEMDETQRNQFQAILSSRRERMRQRAEAMRPQWEEMRAAQEAGDEARVQELRKEFEAARPDPEVMRVEFLEEVRGILRDDQKPRLDVYYEHLGSSTGGATESEAGDLRTVLRAARKVSLNSEQKAELRLIGREAMRSLRELRRKGGPSQMTAEERAEMKAAGSEGKKAKREEIRRRNEEAKSQLAATTKERILQMLDEKQAADYEKQLERLERRARNKR